MTFDADVLLYTHLYMLSLSAWQLEIMQSPFDVATTKTAQISLQQAAENQAACDLDLLPQLTTVNTTVYFSDIRKQTCLVAPLFTSLTPVNRPVL